MSTHQPEPSPTPHDEHAAGEASGHGEAHGEAHGGGHAKHRGGHGDHGGGHGDKWLCTYCDMITLLIAFFICILTFASAESGKHKHRKQRDSLLYGTGGTGIAGSDLKTGDQDSIVWRQVMGAANTSSAGSSIPPLYSDPTMQVTGKALAMLDQSTEKTLADSYGITLPLAMLFGKEDSLSSSGKQLLDSMAANVTALPYEVLIQVDTQANLRRGITVRQYLGRQDRIASSRLGIGIAASQSLANESMRFLFVKRAK